MKTLKYVVQIQMFPSIVMLITIELIKSKSLISNKNEMENPCDIVHPFQKSTKVAQFLYMRFLKL